MKGLYFYRNQLIGTIYEPIDANNYLKYYNEELNAPKPELEDEIAYRVNQFYITSMDSTITIPIARTPTPKSLDIDECVSDFRCLIKLLAEDNVKVVCTCTDGFDTGDKIGADMEKIGVYDNYHTVKNARNQLIGSKALIAANNKPISFANLFKFYKQDSTRLPSLKPNDLHPSDKMKMEPVQNLISSDTINDISKYVDEIGVEFHQYLDNLKKCFDFFSCNNQDGLLIQSNIDKLDELVQYFCSIKNLTDPLKKQFIRTGKSIKEMFKLKYITTLKFSHLSTNCNELHFSNIRRKSHYPSLYDYFLISNAAHILTMEDYAIDRPPNSYEPSQQSKKKKCYNSNVSLTTQTSNMYCSKKTKTILIQDQILDMKFKKAVKTLTRYYLKRVCTVREISCYKQDSDGKFDMWKGWLPEDIYKRGSYDKSHTDQTFKFKRD